MFNNYYGGDTNISNTLKINAVSGGIYKTYRESWFKRFHLKSELMSKLSNHSKVRYNESTDEYIVKDINYINEYEQAKPIVVLQMVICGDMEVIAEIIYAEDLDKHLEETKDE